jgi:stearoyl-CoA desaturase (delta-9 desaturase)
MGRETVQGIVVEAPAPPPEGSDAIGSDGMPTPVPVFTLGRIITALLVVGPLVALVTVLPLLGGRVVNLADLIIGLVFYTFTGFGISIGFHRLLTHRSFKATRALKIVCAVAGSMALEGSVISWVAIHRKHHMFGDQPGDPHSPHRYGSSSQGIVKGFIWAHVGWLFGSDGTDTCRFAPDLLRDPDLVTIDRLFPVLAVASLTLPFFLGWAVTGSLVGGLGALVWAGLLRMALLHHVTWSVNSVCHLWGARPFVTSDRSTNFAPLALASFGESWHNFHHAAPSSARHGVLPHQHDLSARVISWFERAGWATKVRWPNPVQIVALLQPGPEEARIAAERAAQRAVSDGDAVSESFLD